MHLRKGAGATDEPLNTLWLAEYVAAAEFHFVVPNLTRTVGACLKLEPAHASAPNRVWSMTHRTRLMRSQGCRRRAAESA